ncbi:Chromatin assembly factor 1 subunit B [Rasamsonia emersonii CBS 393.64]|uniref:Chromatin assembly factor 1 subunit B n=1 Tax=Rasamsonia emersonii (strain ATCC 16479 / CBS 393.64 / IMI 116815) TaxID=1408163 RepID=A0A0F4Z4B4_RASE3|nr:Chromatin assembly factor 1 subunit B [Rasamsonia emersonii CBS 393.64]KKA25160.1 Chromatin assembly factor 1 subunit B [Rasamsonia emersonii CBS 393.64]
MTMPQYTRCTSILMAMVDWPLLESTFPLPLWKVEGTGEERKITYLSTLVKHTQAVNVVRFSPKGEMLASAGDDGNVLLWVPSELQTTSTFGEDRSDDKETWRVKHMCRSSGAEIYDLAWSPDGVFIITGSMDNIARIYNAQTGQMVRQIAEHSHYVQGVAWDPLNEFVATQSSDRSVHIYSLKTKDGQFSLTTHGKFLKMDLPARRVPSSSPAPSDVGNKTQSTTSNPHPIASPAPSAPGTPKATALPMDPPPVSHSRRSSFGSSPSIRRSASPAPSLPLPAVKPMEVSSPGLLGGLGVKNANLYANETFTSFFRRLTFAPDGSLLFTPAGQYKTSHVSPSDPSKTVDEVINTVYIYTRAGFNKPPIAHLPGHKKPSVAVRCSPVYYTLRQAPRPTSHITLDTSSGEDAFPSLPDPVVASNVTSHPSMEPPPVSATSDPSKPPKTADSEANSSPAFALPYRIVYAVATQDAVLVYDTQQQTPLCVVSNLHFATFTDLTWSNDGLTLIMSSSDGFCSTLSFAPGELGQPYVGPVPTPHHHAAPSTASSASITPLPTPTQTTSPSLVKASTAPSSAGPAQPSSTNAGRPASPPHSTSTSSNNTNSATQLDTVVNNPTPTLGSVPLVTAANSAQPQTLPLTTTPQTPMSGVSHSATSSMSGSVLGKRDIGAASESEKEETKAQSKEPSEQQQQQQQPKKRRIAPTLISGGSSASTANSNQNNTDDTGG